VSGFCRSGKLGRIKKKGAESDENSADLVDDEYPPLIASTEYTLEVGGAG
jgi:hypothetical protein